MLIGTPPLSLLSWDECLIVVMDSILCRMLKKKPFTFFSRGKINVTGLPQPMDTYFMELANGTIEGIEETSQLDLTVNNQTKIYPSLSFVEYSHPQLKISATSVAHNSTVGSIISEGENKHFESSHCFSLTAAAYRGD